MLCVLTVLFILDTFTFVFSPQNQTTTRWSSERHQHLTGLSRNSLLDTKLDDFQSKWLVPVLNNSNEVLPAEDLDMMDRALTDISITVRLNN